MEVGLRAEYRMLVGEEWWRLNFCTATEADGPMRGNRQIRMVFVYAFCVASNSCYRGLHQMQSDNEANKTVQVSCVERSSSYAAKSQVETRVDQNDLLCQLG